MKQLQLQLFAGRPGQTAATQPAAAPHAGTVLADELTRLMREPVEVQLTDNAWTMVSYKRLQGRVRFRLHHMFAVAHEDVVRALAGFTGRNRRTHGRAIDAYIRDHRELIRPPCDRPAPALEQRGRVHDLAVIFARLNAEQFAGRIDARIGWGRRAPLGRRTSMKMGVYLHEQKLIRIHPALDHEQVPRYFVELVVFHLGLVELVVFVDAGPDRPRPQAPNRRRVRRHQGAGLHGSGQGCRA